MRAQRTKVAVPRCPRSRASVIFAAALARPGKEADIATTRRAGIAGISRGRRDLEALYPQVLALPRAAGVHLNGRKGGQRDREDRERGALTRKSHPTADQDVRANVVEETGGRQRGEAKQTQVGTRVRFLAPHGADGVFEKRRPGRVTVRDQRRVAIENEVRRIYGRPLGPWEGDDLVGDLAQERARRC